MTVAVCGDEHRHLCAMKAYEREEKQLHQLAGKKENFESDLVLHNNFLYFSLLFFCRFICLSVCLFVRLEQLGLHRTYFR